MRTSALHLLSISLLLIILNTPAPVSAQNVIEVRRDQLTLQPNQGLAGFVQWSLGRSGTRRENTRCTIENGPNFRNTAAEVVIRLTDNGGLINDPACDFNLRFQNLRNSFVFSSVTMDQPLLCGNPPCATEIVRTNNPGDTSFDVLLRLKMKGVPTLLAFGNTRLAVVRVRLNLSSPADHAIFDPFVQAFIPDLYVAKIKPGFSLVEKKCKIAVTLVNNGETGWTAAQPGAYASSGSPPDRRVFVSLKRNGQQCGVASMLLIDFDPDRNLTRTNNPVSRTWPGCSFPVASADTFEVTVDSTNQLVEQSETNKTKSVKESCITLPGSSPIHP